MEYLRGLRPRGTGRAARSTAARPGVVYYSQVCLALRKAHAAGLIHRDIKPSNIFASRRGGMDDVAKLFDFGFVLSSPESGTPNPTRRARISARRSSCRRSRPPATRTIDGRSDYVFARRIAYYLLTGPHPSIGDDGIELMIRLPRPRRTPSQVLCRHSRRSGAG